MQFNAMLTSFSVFVVEGVFNKPGSVALIGLLQYHSPQCAQCGSGSELVIVRHYTPAFYLLARL